MPISTSTSGVDASGAVFVYVPPNVSKIPRGSSISYGTYNQVTAGDEVTLTGVVQVANGSGTFQATGQVIYRTVTITAPPV